MDVLGALLLGLPLTIAVTVCAFAIGAVLAIPIMILLRSHLLPVRLATRFVVDIIRGIPPIVWLFILYFGVSIGSWQFSSFQAAVIGLGVISSAYLAEIYRGALKGVGDGQWEAGHALGLNGSTMYASIIGPQALRVALPSVATYAISLFKDSSIASVIGVTEVMFTATSLTRGGANGLVVLGAAAAIYIVLSLPLAYLARRVDARMRAVVAR
ncbi:amino acid ABC transporter permease [Microbacterium allomyrinae]|uniref:Amino acid ABC transporter permease n=1 Tax=Microbacterium allomyrinae TaxID=2830666 RepID=A0A9X1S438_9MICO|nr:amino acid ABC transporter permease [Microbacterium allomyrinae]MCC2032640.1 amino acid ABC transporter permease [Microbacterium allomyrinae]